MSLTTTAKTTKLAFWVSVLFIFVFLLGRYIFIPVFKNAYLAAFPPKNPPNPIYGQLDPIEFEPVPLRNTAPPKYTLFTATGKLPTDLPARSRVYQYNAIPFSYEAGKRAAENALKLGFDETMLSTSLKENEYKWTHPSTGATLTINIRTGELEMRTPTYSLANSYKPGSINNITAPTTARNVLQQIGRFSDPLYTQGAHTTELGMIRNGNIVHTSFQGEAELARVDFFRNLGNIPVVGPKYKEGLIHMIVGIPTEKSPIKKTPYIYYNVREINQETNATYPLLPISVAWAEISKGNGVITHVRPTDQSVFGTETPVQMDEILITDIFLAYYDDRQEQNYVQPIYVFEGNYTTRDGPKGSVALYYPAISGEYIKQETENSLE